MLLFNRSKAKEFLRYVSTIKREIEYWEMIEIVLTGKTSHNIVWIGRQIERKVYGEEGAIYIHDGTRILCFIKHGVPAKECSEKFRKALVQALPEHSCEVVSTELHSRGLRKVTMRLMDGDVNTDQHSTLYTQRAERAGKIIMIADANKEMSAVLREPLQRLGEVVCVHDADRMLDVYLEKVPDIVFLDVELPGKAGGATLDRLLKYDKDAYVVMLAEASTAGNVVSARTRGASGFIRKPFGLSRIEEEVSRCPTMRASGAFT